MGTQPMGRMTRALIKLEQCLKTEGRLIASLPNVARLENRLKLLFGKFEYQETGILDKTHLRFFTLKTAKSFLKAQDIKSCMLTTPGFHLKIFCLDRFQQCLRINL
jgi:hypothetical protein